MDLNKLFYESLNQISKEFQNNELAYLALTSKPESQLRDAISFQLYKKTLLIEENISIDREWKRVDLAILKNNIPTILVEFKCAYTFDFIDNNPVGKKYINSVIQDLSKSLIYATSTTDIYAVLFAVHPLRRPKMTNFSDVKYTNGINKALNIHKENEISELCNTAIVSYFQDWKIYTKLIPIECGEAFDVPVKILSWLMGPYHKHEIASFLDFHK